MTSETNPFIQPRLNSLRLNATMTIKNQREIPRPTPASRQPTTHHSSEYKPVKFLGKGAFGKVFVARAPDGELVAVKKVLQDPRYKNRELDTLRLLHHRNCITLKHAFKSRGQNPADVYLNLVTDYLPLTLHQFVFTFRQDRMYPPILFIKLFIFQLFAGLQYIHSIGITHRDLKPPNLIVDPETGELKICDFGSAKMLQPGDSSVSYIASRFYRAPELIYDCTTYTEAIDIWAAGCVFAEAIMAGTPLFPGNDSIGQLTEIAKVIGPPTEADLASFEHNLDVKVPDKASTTLEATLPVHTPLDVIDLLTKIFVYNPGNRPSAVECLQHKCFDDLFVAGICLPNRRPLPPLDRGPVSGGREN
jgi:glycogen synthase kinase 3 beta